MKKWIIFFVFFLVFTISGWSQKTVIAVVPFDAMNGYTKVESEVVSDLFSTYIVESGGFDVVTRSQFNRVLDELNFQMSGYTSETDYARIGAALNAKAIITGSLMKLGSRTILTSSIIEVETARILSSSRLQLQDIDEVFDRIPTLAMDLLKYILDSYKIGDKGLGGGIVFVVNGNTGLEVSPLIGEYNMAEAERVARNYRGGGFNDWYIPSHNDFGRIIRSNVIGLGSVYWMPNPNDPNSSHPPARFPLLLLLIDGSNISAVYDTDPNRTGRLRLVRAF
jgi:TolB-like protein